MKITKKQLAKYVNAASDLADSVKRNIMKDGCIDNKTVLALNALIIATNEIADFTDEVSDRNKSH